MKAGILFAILVALAAGRASGQPVGASIGRTNAPAFSFDTAASPYLDPGIQAKESEVRIGKNLHARGPLIRLFHTRKPGEVPKRFWQMINPFSRSEAAPETEVIRTRDLSPRAWATTVGWHPGVSACADALTQPEGGQGIGLVSIGH